MTTSTITIKNLIRTLDSLINNEVPSDCMSDDGTQVTGHWSGTKEDMEIALGRALSKEEVTCLSLSRCFGPTPSLTSEEAKDLFSRVWPEGNASGSWLTWEELAEVLTPKVEIDARTRLTKDTKMSSVEGTLAGGIFIGKVIFGGGYHISSSLTETAMGEWPIDQLIDKMASQSRNWDTNRSLGFLLMGDNRFTVGMPAAPGALEFSLVEMRLNDLEKEVSTSYLANDGGLTMAGSDLLSDIATARKVVAKGVKATEEWVDFDTPWDGSNPVISIVIDWVNAQNYNQSWEDWRAEAGAKEEETPFSLIKRLRGEDKWERLYTCPCPPDRETPEWPSEIEAMVNSLRREERG